MIIPHKYARELPNKPSELILVALSDLQSVMQRSGHVINMRVWCEFGRQTAVCMCCLAGAVMVARLDAKNRVRPMVAATDPLLYEEPIANKLRALDFFRCGEVRSGLCMLKIKQTKQTAPTHAYVRRNIKPYREADHGRAFIKDMKRLAADLQRVGL